MDLIDHISQKAEELKVKLRKRSSSSSSKFALNSKFPFKFEHKCIAL